MSASTLTSKPATRGGVPPARSLAQRMEALGRANARRSYRAKAKRDLKAGRRTFASVLADPEFATADVFDVLIEVPRYGRIRAGRVLAACRIAATKTCGGLTDRQRSELLEVMSPRPEIRTTPVQVGRQGLAILDALSRSSDVAEDAVLLALRLGGWPALSPTDLRKAGRRLQARELIDIEHGVIWRITQDGRTAWAARREALRHG